MEHFLFAAMQKERTTMKIIYKDGTVAECPQEEELHLSLIHI